MGCNVKEHQLEVVYVIVLNIAIMKSVVLHKDLKELRVSWSVYHASSASEREAMSGCVVKRALLELCMYSTLHCYNTGHPHA